MENLISCYKHATRVRLGLECGDSIRSALYVQGSDPFDQILQRWLFCFDQKLDFDPIYLNTGSYERAFLEILHSGLLGNSIYTAMVEFETEMKERCVREIQKKIDLLPFKLMIPVLLLQFPAYLMLIIGPIFKNFLDMLGGY